MGCGASSARIVEAQNRNIQEAPLLEKPVLGGVCADVVQGTPVNAGCSANTEDRYEAAYFGAATKIQAGFRGQKVRKEVEARREQLFVNRCEEKSPVESQRKVNIVKGLSDASRAIIAINIVSASGLALAASQVADAMPRVSSDGDAPQQTASEIASAALVAARAGSETAEGLIQRATSLAIEVAQARSGNSAHKKSNQVTALPVVARGAPGEPKNMTYSQILGELFKGGDF